MVGFSILLPRAEGKASGGNPFAPDMFDYRTSATFNYFSRLNHARRALIDALHAHIDEAEFSHPPTEASVTLRPGRRGEPSGLEG